MIFWGILGIDGGWGDLLY